MYGWLWRQAPGPWWVKLFFALALIGAVVALCFQFFFPWISPKLPFNQSTIEGGPESPGPTPTVTAPAQGDESPSATDPAAGDEEPTVTDPAPGDEPNP
ncbi:MAG: hypothetical protein FWD29_05945 [Micrococcales bacterium]|nr:hypothetical protein [Micrococcales bacterium]